MTTYHDHAGRWYGLSKHRLDVCDTGGARVSFARAGDAFVVEEALGRRPTIHAETFRAWLAGEEPPGPPIEVGDLVVITRAAKADHPVQTGDRGVVRAVHPPAAWVWLMDRCQYATVSLGSLARDEETGL